MAISRIYQPSSLTVDQTLRLDEKASHHVARVLRAKHNDALILFNGDGNEYEAIITAIEKKWVEVKILHCIARDNESPLTIILAQGLAKGEKMDFIIQKAVELGVKKIIPLKTERSNVRLDDERSEKRLAHWQSVMVSACEQSGRNKLAEITAAKTLAELFSQIKADYYFVLSPHVATKLDSEKLAKNATIVLLIGPEGGLSEKEMAEAMQTHYVPLNLGPRILRTETATLAAITLLQCQFGDMNIIKIRRKDGIS